MGILLSRSRKGCPPVRVRVFFYAAAVEDTLGSGSFSSRGWPRGGACGTLTARCSGLEPFPHAGKRHQAAAVPSFTGGSPFAPMTWAAASGTRPRVDRRTPPMDVPRPSPAAHSPSTSALSLANSNRNRTAGRSAQQQHEGSSSISKRGGGGPAGRWNRAGQRRNRVADGCLAHVAGPRRRAPLEWSSPAPAPRKDPRLTITDFPCGTTRTALPSLSAPAQ